MINRQLYTIKFESSRLKKSKYSVNNLSFAQAKKNQEIISIGENQIIRTINNVMVNELGKSDRFIDREKLEEFYQEIERIKRGKKIPKKDAVAQIKDLKEKIVTMCYIPEYITVVIEHDKHYEEIYNNGFKVNGIEYRRLSVSAGQGRMKTVVFCSVEIIDRVNEILDNGRKKDVPFSPSKFSAYKGLYGSATKIVTEPRFCVIADYESESTFDCNWVTETHYDKDDIIEEKTITRSYNRFDGMGLISPELAKQWSIDLGLSYVPSEFCIRQSFLKGMVAVFDHKLFCEKFNNSNFIIKDVYGNEQDIRDVDLILTESQFKLKKCYDSVEQYVENCRKNKLYWGVSLYTEEILKNSLRLNYQFLGAMDIKKEDIPQLCDKFVRWIQSVNHDDVVSALLFLVGENMTEKSVQSYLKGNDNYWIKALMLNHELIHDKYIKQKIYGLIKKRIENSYIGAFFVDGNNQTLVSDPFGLAQHLYGLEVTGLLKKNEHYSKFWLDRGECDIVGMRPPLTYRAETLRMKVVQPEMPYGIDWYEYLYGGIVVNIHGSETDFWAGSDFDFDFLSTTSDKIIYKSIYENESPVCYEPPKVAPIVFTDRDLYISDTFTFGSVIGSITNKGTSGHALLPLIAEKYGIDSKQYITLLNRVKMTCKLQSAQIDKAKIGRDVKEIPRVWTDRKYINETFVGEEKDIMLELMLDRHPYFFVHLYPETKTKYKNHVKNHDITCQHKFGLTLDKLIELDNKTDEQLEYLSNFEKYMPVINTDSVMNNICRYLEGVDFEVKKYIQGSDVKECYSLLLNDGAEFNDDTFKKVLKECKMQIKLIAEFRKASSVNSKRKFDSKSNNAVDSNYKMFEDAMSTICPNVNELVNYLINIFYVNNPSSNKDILWGVYGEVIVDNLRKDKMSIMFPIKSDDGEIAYLGNKYTLREVSLV